jgi:hypothetical protein
MVGQATGRLVGKALNKTKTVKTLQIELNTQKNAARGKSNIIPKRKADVKGAQKRLDKYIDKRIIGASTIATGIGSEVYKNVIKNNNEIEKK